MNYVSFKVFGCVALLAFLVAQAAPPTETKPPIAVNPIAEFNALKTAKERIAWLETQKAAVKVSDHITPKMDWARRYANVQVASGEVPIAGLLEELGKRAIEVGIPANDILDEQARIAITVFRDYPTAEKYANQMTAGKNRRLYDVYRFSGRMKEAREAALLSSNWYGAYQVSVSMRDDALILDAVKTWLGVADKPINAKDFVMILDTASSLGGEGSKVTRAQVLAVFTRTKAMYPTKANANKQEWKDAMISLAALEGQVKWLIEEEVKAAKPAN